MSELEDQLEVELLLPVLALDSEELDHPEELDSLLLLLLDALDADDSEELDSLDELDSLLLDSLDGLLLLLLDDSPTGGASGVENSPMYAPSVTSTVLLPDPEVTYTFSRLMLDGSRVDSYASPAPSLIPMLLPRDDSPVEPKPRYTAAAPVFWTSR